MNLYIKRPLLLLFALLAFGSFGTFIFDGKVYASDELKLAKSSRFAGDVVLIKGGFDVFSGGFDKIATKLAKKGIKATVSRHTKVKQIANQIIANRKKYGRKPVVLIGHSWGAKRSDGDCQYPQAQQNQSELCSDICCDKPQTRTF